jgi:hypothetical protein
MSSQSSVEIAVDPRPPAVSAAANSPVVTPQPAPVQPPAPPSAVPFLGGNGALVGWLRETPSWFASMLIHLTAIILIAMIRLNIPPPEVPAIIGGPTESGNLQEFGDGGNDDVTTSLDPNVAHNGVLQSGMALENASTNNVPLNPLGNDLDSGPARIDLSPFGSSTAPSQNFLKSIGGVGGMGEGIGGRTGAAKSELLKRGGGNEQSEDAVARALKWLSIHQMPDGGWDFDLRDVPACKGKCDNSGDASRARNGATALALLPFLGAGQTHMEGQYKKNVERGLYYLTTHARAQGNGVLSYYEDGGTMYSHGLATIVLCEAFAMTKDRSLRPYAQGAIDFIQQAQDPSGGGWRYQERQAGDTSVVGWQIMALKSAQMGGLEVRSTTMLLANKFLDSVQDDGGAAYGYTAPSATRPGTSSIGLLTRMYLGWRRQNPALERGVDRLDLLGPSIKSGADMYYNYYATQVMRHWGGDAWERWNYRIRDWLISQQEHKGHEEGSWYMNDYTSAPKATAGGRLYCTSMSTLILEVYYRHLPLYGPQTVKDEFSQ